MLLAALIVAGIVTIVNKTETGKRTLDRVVMKIPAVSTIYRELAIQRMATTMSSLMKAGLPIIQTITIAADTVGVREYRSALLRVANEGLAKSNRRRCAGKYFIQRHYPSEHRAGPAWRNE